MYLKTSRQFIAIFLTQNATSFSSYSSVYRSPILSIHRMLEDRFRRNSYLLESCIRSTFYVA